MKEFKDEEIGISTAYDLSLLPKDEQAQALEGYKEAGAETIKEATAKLYPAFRLAGSQPVAQAAPAADEAVSTPIAALSQPPVRQAPTVVKDTTPVPKAISPQPPVINERPPVDPAQANEAQREILLDLGKDAVREYCMTDDHEQQVRFARRIEAFTDVAVAFGIRDYEDIIHSIPEYINKYRSDANEGE